MDTQSHPFASKSFYRVKKSFDGGLSIFDVNEILIFEKEAFSPYDDSFIYQFYSQTEKTVKTWARHINEPPEMWQQYFELIEPQSP
jgi:hypothetical protein